MQNIDDKVINLCKKNERKGYEALFKTYQKYIYNLCFFYTNSKEDALDLMQEVFIKIYKSMNKFRLGRPLMPWIKRITVNTCINYQRDKKAATISLSQAVDDDGDNVLENIIPDDTDVEKEVMYYDAKSIILKSINELPAEIKMAIILRHVNGMSYEEIGQAMAIPLGTVKTYIHRGRNLLKDKLKKQGMLEV